MVLSKKELGSLVKKARKLKSEKTHKLYTQQMLAGDISKSQSYIGDIESGRTYPSFVLLNQIAEACDVPIAFFQNSNQLDNDIDNFIKLQLNSAEDEEIRKMREELKNDPDTKMNYIYDYINNTGTKAIEIQNNHSNNLFKTPREAVCFLLNQSVIMNFCGVDISKMSEEEVSNFSDDFLTQLNLISYKYKK